MKLKAKLEASAISGRMAKSKATSTRSKTSLRKNIRVKEKQLWLIESEGEEVEHASGMSEYVGLPLPPCLSLFYDETSSRSKTLYSVFN